MNALVRELLTPVDHRYRVVNAGGTRERAHLKVRGKAARKAEKRARANPHTARRAAT